MQLAIGNPAWLAQPRQFILLTDTGFAGEGQGTLMMPPCFAVIQCLLDGPDTGEFCDALANEELLEARPPLVSNARRVHIDRMKADAERPVALDMPLCASGRKVRPRRPFADSRVARTGDVQVQAVLCPRRSGQAGATDDQLPVRLFNGEPGWTVFSQV